MPNVANPIDILRDLMKKSTMWLAAGAAVLGGILLGKNSSGASEGPPLDTKGKGSIPWWTDDDFRAFVAMSQRLRMNPADLLIVLYSESGLRPDARNPRSRSLPPIAIGLNQIVHSTARSMGMSDAQWNNLLNLSVAYQLPIVERYFNGLQWVRAGNTFHSAAQVYLANFAPAKLSLGTDPDIVLYTRGKDGQSYELNKGLDHGNKGFITLRDMGITVQNNARAATFLAALDRLRQVTGDPNLTPKFS